MIMLIIILLLAVITFSGQSKVSQSFTSHDNNRIKSTELNNDANNK